MSTQHEEITKGSADEKVFHFAVEINKESDRGAVLFAAAFFDYKLKQIIENYFENKEVSKQATSFNSRINF